MRKRRLSNLDLVGLIYDAALDPDLWPDFLASFASRIQASYGVMTFHNLKERELSFIRTYERDEEMLKVYREHYINVNPYLSVVSEYPHSVFTSNQLVPEKQLTQSEYYNDWLLPQKIHHHAGSIIFRDESRVALLDMQRPPDGNIFEEKDLETIGVFEPHLRRALLINQKFWDLLANPNTAMSVLDHLEIGVIFIDENEAPVYLNRKAEELTKFGDGVIVRPNGLSAEYPKQADVLQKLVHESVETGKGRGLHSGGVVRVGILADSPHHVLVSPMRTEKNDLGLSGQRICAVVFISAPYQPHAVSVESFKNLFDLTQAEAALVRELANGLSLDEIATKMEVSTNTTRDHLKSVFAKTATRRQAELVRLITSTPTSQITEGILLGPSLAGPMERRKVDERRKNPRT